MRWKVSKQILKMFPHPDAEKLEIGKVGDYPVVVGKGLYKDGDIVVFAPEKSVLSGPLRDEFEKYLAGPDKNRVHSVRLRGELSCGIIVPPHLLPDLSGYKLDEDLSEVIGIKKYTPVIPVELLGEVEEAKTDVYAKHEVLHFSIYENDFQAGERILITEKIHGTQCSCVLNVTGETAIMSKGLADEGIAFQPGQDNVYCRSVKASNIFAKLGLLIDALKKEGRMNGVIAVQVIGEAIPACKDFNYGLQNTARFMAFRVEILAESERVRIQYDDPINPFREDWVPVLYDDIPDPGDPKALRKIAATCCAGHESVSGNAIHIREGCVIEPYASRRASDGEALRVKFINPEYKETGEELS